MGPAVLVTALGSGFRAVGAASVFFSTLARPPPGWCLMFSVEPTLERMFFRSGAEAVVAGRLSLGAEELGLAVLGFLSTGGTEGRESGVDLTRVGAAAAGGAAPVGVVVFFPELVGVLLERLRSAGADFTVVFLTSVALPSVLIALGFLGTDTGGVLLLDTAEAEAAAGVAFGAAEVLLGPGLRATAEAGLDGKTCFSGTFTSVICFGFVSLEGKTEVLAVAAAVRLGGAAGTKPDARLMGFLFDPPEVVGAGCLGTGVSCVLAFDAEVFAG